MKGTKFYDEAAYKFYRDKAINSYPISSLDIYAHHYGTLCKNLQDVKLLGDIAKSRKWQMDVPFRSEIMDKDYVVVVTDTKLNIVYASQNIYLMNGYRPEEIIGLQPKMFQGAETCETTKKEVSQAIKNREGFEATLINYRKDGSTYKCWIKGSPVFDRDGKVVNFIAFEREVA